MNGGDRLLLESTSGIANALGSMLSASTRRLEIKLEYSGKKERKTDVRERRRYFNEGSCSSEQRA